MLADDPTSPIRLILAGSRLPTTHQRPSDLAMPGFGWRLSDDEPAQLVNFVRNSWGNHAPEASASEVARVRKELKENGGGISIRRIRVDHPSSPRRRGSMPYRRPREGGDPY